MENTSLASADPRVAQAWWFDACGAPMPARSKT
jgi:hypothetical protein